LGTRFWGRKFEARFARKNFEATFVTGNFGAKFWKKNFGPWSESGECEKGIAISIRRWSRGSSTVFWFWLSLFPWDDPLSLS
jgi:hypothetical protein